MSEAPKPRSEGLRLGTAKRHPVFDNDCPTCRTRHPNGWACPKRFAELEAELKTALEVINDARRFIALGCFTGDCLHSGHDECLSDIYAARRGLVQVIDG